MLPVLAAGAMFAGFTAYPAFGDRSILEPALTPPGVTVEAATDRGPVIEMIVRCPTGITIVSYSKLERVFCTPRLHCVQSLRDTQAEACH